MIRNLWILDTGETRSYKNLAIEEYLLMHVPEGTCIMFLWQNKQTIVIGRNQNPAKECNVENVNKDGAVIVRRLSGGGAVFHDMGNLNFTFLVRREDYDVDRQLQVIVVALAELGIAAEKTGRNDVVVQQRKISGNAFYKKDVFCYHHGTLLVDTDKELIERYLNVSKEKLAMKGVDSVRSRVGNLKDFKEDITVEMVKAALKKAFGQVYGLPATEKAVAEFPADEIDAMAQRFASAEWTYGKERFYNKQMTQRFAWGQMELLCNVKEGVIEDVCIYSDAMEQDYILRIQEALRGHGFDEGSMLAAIDEVAASEAELPKDAAERISQDVKAMIQSAD